MHNVSKLAAMILLVAQLIFSQEVSWEIYDLKEPEQYGIEGDPASNKGANIEFKQKDLPSLRYKALFDHKEFAGKRVEFSVSFESSGNDNWIGFTVGLRGEKKLFHFIDRRMYKLDNGKVDKQHKILFDIPDNDLQDFIVNISSEKAANIAVSNMQLNIIPEIVPIKRNMANNWFVSGRNPYLYKMKGFPEQQHDASQPGQIESIGSFSGNKWASFMTGQRAAQYRGKRVKLSGYVKTKAVSDWASLWMRADARNTMGLTFDNMQNRQIKGDTDWEKYEIVLDVPDSTTEIFYGAVLGGPGKLYFDGVRLEIVGEDIPVTQYDPINDFIKESYENCLKISDGDDLYFKLIKYFALQRLGKEKAASSYLSTLSSKDVWPQHLISFLNGKTSAEILLKLAKDENEKLQYEKLCEAHYYIGMSYLIPVKQFSSVPDIEKASYHLKKCLETNRTDFIEYRIANAELKKINK